MRFRTVVNRVAGIGRAQRPGRPVDIDFSGHRVTALTFAGKSKAGHMSWTGSVGDDPVKLYETSTEAGAALIASISTDQSAGRFFPPVLGTTSRFVLARWVHGEPVRPNSTTARSIGQVLGKIHGVSPDGRSGFDYATYMERRLVRWAGPFLDSHFRSVLDEGVAGFAAMRARTPHISHPDVTFRNLVHDDSGTPVVVDNELLGVGSWYPIDLVNALASFHEVRGASEELLAGYESGGGDPSMLPDIGDELTAAWRLRVVGSLLMVGRLADALEARNSPGLSDDLARLLEAAR